MAAKNKRSSPSSEAEEDEIVRSYLALLAEHPARRGRRRSPEKLRQRIDELASPPPNVDALDWLLLIQERLDLEAELRRLEAMPDVAELEQKFVKVASSFSKRRGVSYAALRQAGVPTIVLRRAGLRGSAVA